LAFTLVNKLYIGTVFEEAMEKKGIAYQRYMTNPMPLQNIMWYMIAEEKEGFYYAYYSWYDDPNKMAFKYFPKNDRGLENIKKTFPIKRLSWFSDAYYIFTRKDNKLYLNDLRFGKAGTLANGNEDFIMHWEIKEHNGVVEIEKHMPTFKWNKKSFDELINRIKGIKKDTL
jgi:inner membrane protein